MEQNKVGVTFHVMHSEVQGNPGGGYSGKVTLHGVVADLDLWEKVIEQLRGMELYKGRDFKSELIEILRQRNDELEQSAGKLADDKDATIQHLMRELEGAQRAQGAAEQNVRIYQAREAALQEELGQLREAKRVMDELSQL